MTRSMRYITALPLVLADAAGACLAMLAAFALRFDGDVPQHYLDQYARWALPLAAQLVVCLYFNGLYRGIWRYAGLRTLVAVARAVTIATGATLLWFFLAKELAFPRTVIILTWFFEISFLGALRMTPRLWRELAGGVVGSLVGRGSAPRRKTLIVGAGDSGASLVRDMLSHPERGFVPIGFVDDDPEKLGRHISGVRVMGSCVSIPSIVRETGARQVFIAAPSAPARLTHDILNYCRVADVQCLTLPALREYAEDRAPLNQVRAVRIEDVVGREQVQVDLSQVKTMVSGKTILVTGAGGSIGSEIARQLARLGPRAVLLLDHAENGLYFCYRDLLEDPDSDGVELHTFVADIKDAEQLLSVFRRHRPQVVFHAAAHKHVPLLEANPPEAVLNNIAGTRNLIRAARQSGVECFVQISTDKAVRPTSVMGATKRICEMLVASAGADGLRFVSVRFGNVMDSEGSVIPLFRRQIARGGPVTVTHRNARRYFMTISEAVRLVLHAATLGRAGEILLLDMGEPVRIMDLAEQMVRLSGFTPGRDIEIREIGLRPGEKMVEQLVSESVASRTTAHDRIRAYEGEPVDAAALELMLDELVGRASRQDTPGVIEMILKVVPDFIPTPGTGTAVGRIAATETHVRSLRPTAASTNGSGEADPRHRFGGTFVPWPRSFSPVSTATLTWKRAFDLAAAIVLFPTVCVAMLVIGAILSVELGPPILIQEQWTGRDRRRRERRGDAPEMSINRRMSDRRGRDLLGEPITLWRFRSEPVSGETRSHFAARNPYFAQHLRATGLDRLPWFFALLRGDIGLVGPAPMETEEAERLGSFAGALGPRFSVRPGCTGLAQTIARGRRRTEERLAYDLYYAAHVSLVLDLRILARACAAAFSAPAPIRDAQFSSPADLAATTPTLRGT